MRVIRKSFLTYLIGWLLTTQIIQTLSITESVRNTKASVSGETFQNWYKRWQNRLRKNSESIESSIDLMKSRNPAVIPRNHKVEEALELQLLEI